MARRTVPADVLAHILSFADASTLLSAEAAARPLKVAIAGHETAFWRGLLRSAFAVEGAALCSLGDGSNERRLYRGFLTAQEVPVWSQTSNIAKRRDARALRQALRSGNYGEDRLAFIVTVGGFAGIASWTMVSEGLPNSTRTKVGLRWEPSDTSTHFEFESPEALADVHMWSDADIMAFFGSQLEQTLYVMDMRSFRCARLLEKIKPWSVNIIGAGIAEVNAEMETNDVLTYSSAMVYFRHNCQQSDGTPICFSHWDEERMWEQGMFSSDVVDYCMLAPFITFRHDSDVYRLQYADLVFDHGEYMTVTTPQQFREFVVDLIEQVHEEESD